jgi:hypothetical protein
MWIEAHINAELIDNNRCTYYWALLLSYKCSICVLIILLLLGKVTADSFVGILTYILNVSDGVITTYF